MSSSLDPEEYLKKIHILKNTCRLTTHPPPMAVDYTFPIVEPTEHRAAKDINWGGVIGCQYDLGHYFREFSP